MLVLTRKVGEKLVIGDGQIVVKVKRLAGSRVTLAIEAPRHVSVRRGELPPHPPEEPGDDPDREAA